jgi:hypothetical protein
MSRLFLISRRDPEESYMARQWGGALYRETRGIGAGRLLDCPTRQEVEAQLTGAEMVLFFGHGSDTALGSPAIIDKTNIHLATGIVVAVACWSANQLGPEARSTGAEAFVGFCDEIHIVDSDVIDRLIRDGFDALSTGTESPAEFEQRFRAACGEVQRKYLGVKRDTDAHVIGAAAQTLKLALRVL